MNQNLAIKILVILGIIGFSLYSSLPLEEKINLGLDLQGGMHLILQVESDKVVENELEKLRKEIQRTLVKAKIRFENAEINEAGDGVTIEFKDQELYRNAMDIFREEFDFYDRTEGGTMTAPQVTLKIPQSHIEQLKEEAFNQALDTIRNRVDEFGVKEPIIQRQGIAMNRILVQLPGAKDAERAKKNIGKTAFLEFQLVREGPAPREDILENYDGYIPADAELLPSTRIVDTERMYYLLEKDAPVTGADLETARLGRDQYGRYAVDFQLNRMGGRKFGKMTSENIGAFIAIVLDDKVQSAPRVQSRITDSGQITGDFTLDEAKDLAIVLRAGALPAPVKYLEERTVGPSLGKDSITAGLRAILIGGIAVLIFMVIYYKFAGLIADFAMILNLVILTGALAVLKASLTLPGIAGIILTIGMAVDANVLVFERIREELDLAKTVRTSVAFGFKKAFLTILDANVTTMIAALVLMNFGTGPVKGFAVTLSIGIVASMFTALFVSRVIFDLLLLNRKVVKLSI